MAILALVVAAPAVSWETLCIGDDGHVAFEPVASGHCAAGAVQGGVSEEILSIGARDAWPCCGPCTDLRSPGDPWLTSGSNGIDFGSRPLLVAPGLPHLPADGKTAPVIRRVAAGALASPPRILASVVVRC